MNEVSGKDIRPVPLDYSLCPVRLLRSVCRRVWLVTVKAALGCVCVCVFTAHVTETSSITDNNSETENQKR